MCATLRLFSAFMWLLCFCGITAAEAGTGCKVVNLMPAFWRSLAKSDASAQIRATLIVPYPDLYNDNYVNLPSGAKWDATVARERTYVETHREEVTAAESYLSAHAQPLMAQFQRTFPDYKCDFTFYIAPSFGQMDGSAAFVNGQHRIIFAPDVIPRYHQPSELKVLIDHETFHIYHHQATGVYGASAEAVPTFLHYFVAGKQPEGYPPRAGYFMGALIAQDLSARYTLPQLAHLNGSELHTLVTKALEKFVAAH
jgi:hypothetical protein